MEKRLYEINRWVRTTAIFHDFWLNNDAHLAGVLKTASTWRSRSAAVYASYLGNSAAFGSGTDLQLSPPNGPQWNNSLLLRSPYFINCHGAPSDPHFYG